MTAFTGLEQANVDAILSAGRMPRWVEQDSYSGAPTSAADGVSFIAYEPSGGSIVAAYLIALREVVHARTSRVTITNAVAGQTYTVTVGGNAVAVVAATSTAAGIIAQLVAALAGVPAAAALVTFTAVDADGDGTVDTLRVRGRAEADYTIGISATGAATIACDADPSGANVRMYFYPRRPYTDENVSGTVDEPEVWAINPDGDELLDHRGCARRAFPASWSRGYIELHAYSHPGGDAAGAGGTLSYSAGGGVWWGPAIQEA